LNEGSLTIGALDDNDIVVSVRGVSRNHARLIVGPEEVVLEDLNSKNGSFVNGRRTSRSTLIPGDTLDFGSASMQFRQVDPDDVEVAIEMERRRIPRAIVRNSGDDTHTEHLRGSDQPTNWIQLIGRYAAVVGGLEEPGLGDGLELVSSELGCSGLCAFSWSGDEDPLVRGSFGRIFPFFDDPEVHLFLADAKKIGNRESVLISHVRKEAPKLAWAIAAEPGEDLWGLVVNHDFSHLSSLRPLLESLLQVTVAASRDCLSTARSNGAAPDIELTIPEGHIVGRSEAFLKVYEQLKQLLQGDIPVLICGETGVGKEHVARLLHDSSARAEHPFVAVNCAAIPEELLESELFGIRSGVATGVTERKGRFEQARGGTIVLDEIGEMPLSLQAKLLRVVQEMEVHPLGANLPVPIDVRIVSMSNAALQELVKEGKFRRDLYYRIAGFTLEVPPLRDRSADIPLLVEHFMRAVSSEIGKPIRGISVKALHLLEQAPWPGNVRELRHEIRRLVYLCGENQIIDSSMLSAALLVPDSEELDLSPSADLNLERHTADLERRFITLALARAKNNRTQAAKLLGISRNGLAMKMERLGVGV
jgi:DNA-binding NtrC family response regulator